MQRLAQLGIFEIVGIDIAKACKGIGRLHRRARSSVSRTCSAVSAGSSASDTATIPFPRFFSRMGVGAISMSRRPSPARICSGWPGFRPSVSRSALGTVIRPVASRVTFIAGRMAQKWERGNHSRLRRLFQPAPRCSTREAPSIPRKKMRLPPPWPAEGVEGSVGLGRWMRPRSGIQRAATPRAYVRLHGRIPTSGAPAPRCGAPSPVHEGGNLVLLLCRGIFPHPAGMRNEVICSSDAVPTQGDLCRPALP